MSGAEVPIDREQRVHATNNALQLVQTALYGLRGLDEGLSPPETVTLHQAIDVGLSQLERLLVPAAGASTFLLSDAVMEAAHLARKRGAGVRTEVADGVHAHGDRDEVTRVLEELFVAASVTRGALARVEDDGGGGLVHLETDGSDLRPIVLRLTVPPER